MLEYKDTTKEQKREIYDKAFNFLHDHADHVAALLKCAKEGVSPSGSDMFKPELWKAVHWRWFYEINKSR